MFQELLADIVEVSKTRHKMSSDSFAIYNHLSSNGYPVSPDDFRIISSTRSSINLLIHESLLNLGDPANLNSQTSTICLPQFYLANPGFQLIWMKVSLPNTLKFICTLYRSPNSTNHECLFDHLSKTIDTSTLQSPRSKITILGDFNVYNTNWLTHSPHITSPADRDAEAFAIVNDLSQLKSEPTRILDRSGDKANTLDLFLT